MTNGGPVFVYVKDGKIVRMTPIDLAEDDGASWTIEARGREAHAAAQDHAGAARAERQVDRLFARPPALSDEAGRLRSQRRAQSAEPRQVRLRAHLLGGGDQASSPTRSSGRSANYGPGCIAVSHGSHHTWGNIGYYLSALFRFANAIGMTRVHHNPDSLGRLVLGRGASLGLHAARRPVGDLRHGRGLPAELRHDRVVGGRPGDRRQAPTARRKAPCAGSG